MVILTIRRFTMVYHDTSNDFMSTMINASWLNVGFNEMSDISVLTYKYCCLPVEAQIIQFISRPANTSSQTSSY